MKYIWKPLDVLGLRLYQVKVGHPSRRDPSGINVPADVETKIVAATAPRHAMQIVSAIYAALPADRRPYCTGMALTVGQPDIWFDLDKKLPYQCDHLQTETIQGSSGPYGRYENVSICLDCGRIKVVIRSEGKIHKIEFGLNCDWHLLAAARYMRSPEEAQQAYDRTKPTTEG